jgi:hypothetical protein
MKKIRIVPLSGYAAFKEIILSLEYSLKKLGFDVEQIFDLTIDKNAINILFAGHHTCLTVLKNANIPLENIIVYNLEQVGVDVPWMTAQYFELMKYTHVWEYSESNFQQLKQAGIHNIVKLPIGYTPNLEIIPKIDSTQQDIDVFFYGSLSQRRLDLLQKLKETGLNIVSPLDYPQGIIVGKERDDLIARSKVLLNMHFYDNAHIFEIVRISYLLANAKAVVSELGQKTEIEEDIKHGIIHGSLENLPNLCLDLVHNIDKRKKLEQTGYDIIRVRDYTQSVQKSMEAYLASTHKNYATVSILNEANQENNIALPKRINIGCGLDWHYDMTNLDKQSKYQPDLCLDLNEEIDFTQTFDTWRFGAHTNLMHYFTHIEAQHIFECADNMRNMLTNCLNMLAEGGSLRIKVVYDLSDLAWSNPEYKRHFNQSSFLYYMNPNHLFNLGWYDYTFNFSHCLISLSTYGEQQYHKHQQNIEEIKRMPRVIDYLTFDCIKRATTINEKLLFTMRKSL